jgi:competence protein ComGC
MLKSTNKYLASCFGTPTGTGNTAEQALSQMAVQNFGLKHERKARLGDLARNGSMIQKWISEKK